MVVQIENKIIKIIVIEYLISELSKSIDAIVGVKERYYFWFSLITDGDISPSWENWFIILLFFEFFTAADGLSLEFEWQQVSSSLNDSPQYSGRS